MSEGNGARRGIHFVPEIKLGDLVGACLMLLSVGAAYATLKGDISHLAANDVRHDKALEQKADRDAVGKAEVELSRRITEQQGQFNHTQLRTSEDIKEIKTIIRDGFRDLDMKLDRKVDKPGR